MREIVNNHTVLVVEDEAIVALDLRKQLEISGYRVVGIVGRSDEVITAVQTLRPGAVLMDVNLRGAIDGVTLAEEIFVCEDTPVVFLTAFSDTTIVDRASRCGAYGYLTKPVSHAALTATLDLAIEKHRDLCARRGDAQWFHRAFEAFDAAIVGLDDAGGVQFMNRKAVQLSGWMLMEAKNNAPPWAEQLHALPHSESASASTITVLHTRGPLRTSVIVQKFPLEQGGSVCMIRRSPLEADVGPTNTMLM